MIDEHDSTRLKHALDASRLTELEPDIFPVFDIVFSATRRQLARNRYIGVASVIDAWNNLHREMFCLK